VWILILILTGSFQFYRGAPVDGIVFMAMAAALIADAIDLIPPIRSQDWRPSRIVTVVVLALTAAVLALTPRQGIADGVVLVVTGALVFVVAWPDHIPAEASTESRGRWSPRMSRSAALWATVGIAFCLWELTMCFLSAYVPGGRNDFPALSDLLDPLIQNPIGRIIFVAAWLLGGIGLSRRGRAR
jgi:hypothetical protein